MQNNAHNLIPAAAADKLISAHDGDVALLYIWLCRNGRYEPDRAANELCRTLSEIDSAYEKLCRMDILCTEMPEQPKKVLPAEELPVYTADDIVRRSREDSSFSAVITEAQRIFGRSLSSSDMKTLFGIYDYLALPPEVIFQLLNYCVTVFREKYGTGRLPSMRSIEKEAYSWANKEILTFEQAEEYIKAAAEKRSKLGEVREALGIRGRELTSTETKYISSWLDMGFDCDALLIAYDRTVTNTGALKWGYMNKIVLSWHEKGLHSVSDINEKDSRVQKKVSGKTQSVHAKQDDLERMRAIYDKIKNG